MLSDGRRVLVRPLNFDEYGRLEELYSRSSEESLRKRFGWTDAREWLRGVKGGVEELQMCLVALWRPPGGGCEEVVGDCWYLADQGTGSAEVSILVRDDFQNRRLGTQMMTQLVRIARARGLYRLFALVSVTNVPMLRIVRRLGFRFVHGADGVNLYRLDL